MGVAASSFWHMTPTELQVHAKGYERQVRFRSQEANIYAWLTGAYVRLAVASVLDSGTDYPEKPFGLEETGSQEPWELSKMKMAGFAVKVGKPCENKAD